MAPADDEYLESHRTTIETAFTRALAGIIVDKPDDPLFALASQLERLAIERQALDLADQIKQASKKIMPRVDSFTTQNLDELHERFSRFQKNGKLGRAELRAVLNDVRARPCALHCTAQATLH